MSTTRADAQTFAKRYVELTEALMHEGVVEEIAREEARMAAMVLLYEGAGDSGGTCPTCGSKL